MTSYSMEYPFDQFGSAVLTMSLPSLLPTPRLPTFEGQIDHLNAVQALLSSSQNTGVVSTLF